MLLVAVAGPISKTQNTFQEHIVSQYFESQIAADLAALADAQTNHGQVDFAGAEQCERVRAELERVLVSAADRQAYERALRQVCGERVHYTDELPEHVFEQIVEQGLGQLEPEWLARVVLDPVWVQMLSHEISERFPEAWWGAMHRDGMRILEEQGLAEFPLKMERVEEGTSSSTADTLDAMSLETLTRSLGKKDSTPVLAAWSRIHREVSAVAWKAYWGVEVEEKSADDVASSLELSIVDVQLHAYRISKQLRHELEKVE